MRHHPTATHPTLRHAVAAAAACLVATASQATVLTFETYNNVGPATYGDRVTAFGPGYGSGGGATPNITLDFVSLNNNALTVYGSGYATLSSALGSAAFDVPGYVQLTPDAGFDVVLSGFDLGAWSASSYPNSRVRVVDTAGTVFLDTGLFTVAPNVVHSSPSAPIQSALPLRILVDDFGDLGLDNLAFGQTISAVPENSTTALMLAGLAALGGLARRRAHAAAAD